MDIGGGITFGQGINFGIPFISIPILTAGTLAPRYGPGAFITNPTLDGWTQAVSATADDANFLIANFKFYIYGTQYTGLYPGSNTYQTLGTGSSAYSALVLASNPALPGIHLGGADNSWQRVWYKTDGLTYASVRYEGSAATTGTVGAPSIVYETSWYPVGTVDATYQYIEILFGVHGRTTGTFGITKGDGVNFLIGNATAITQNQSYVIRTDNLGNNPQFFTGYHM